MLKFASSGTMGIYMVTLTKAKLSEHLASNMAFDKSTAVQFVDEFFNQLAQALVEGKTVKLAGFGQFLLYDKALRLGRNPKTKVPIWIAERRVAVFKAGKKLKNRIKQSVEEIV
jgi:integration host factor subunit alpha